MPLFVVVLIGVFALITFIKSVRIINQGEKAVVMRLGKFKTVAEPGLNIILPYKKYDHC